MTPERLLALTAAGTLPLPKLPAGPRPQWTVVEAGMAAQGLERDPWYALRYSFAGDDSVREALEFALRAWASTCIMRRWWPLVVREAPPYRYDLVSLHMDEERHTSVFQSAQEMRPLLMACNDSQWRKTLEPLYEEVRLKYLGWLADGRKHMADWLANRETSRYAQKPFGLKAA